ncbi:MAG: hypothetical protein GXP55_03365 [Deltaproteobacteria bacterium]|nr:hypothetical protein [Deltaproteobacteria bacterium]
MAAIGEQAYVSLSSAEGAFLHRLGSPAAPTRLGPECDAGSVLASAGARLFFACMRRGDPARARPGRLLLLELDAGGAVLSRRLLAELGPDPGGVDLVVTAAGPVVAYRDSLGPDARAFVLRADDELPPLLLSNPRARAGDPRLALRGDGFLVTWAETFNVANATAGQVWVTDEQLVPRRAFEIAYATPSPSLLPLEDGVALAFRDHRRPYRRPGLYLARLSDSLEPITEPRRIGRANALGRPELVEDPEGGVFALTPHRWDKHEVLIGVHALGRDLNRLAPEQQDYEYAARIERARGLVQHGTLTLLATERRQFGGPMARARTLTLRCR